MSAEDEMRRELVQLEAMTSRVFDALGMEALRSIQEGSEITGAPGQPVDTGLLKGSWSRTYEDENTQVIGTNVEYAQAIEDGIGPHGPLTLRSSVGGFHSVALTIAGMDRIRHAVVQRLVARD